MTLSKIAHFTYYLTTLWIIILKATVTQLFSIKHLIKTSTVWRDLKADEGA